MARDEHIHLFAANVEGILAGGAADADAFVHLAVSGEQLRRAVRFARAGVTGARRTLRRYDRFLAAYTGGLPPNPGEQVDAVLRDLREYSERAYRARDAEPGRRLLTELDEILSVDAAAWRTGRLGREKVDALAERARAGVREVAPRLHDLWQHAEDAEVRFGPDPALPGLFSFWEELARLAPSRLALAEALRMSPATARARVADEAVKRFEARGGLPRDDYPTAAVLAEQPVTAADRAARGPIVPLQARPAPAPTPAATVASFLGIEKIAAAGTFDFPRKRFELGRGRRLYLFPVQQSSDTGQPALGLLAEFEKPHRARLVAVVEDREFPLEPVDARRRLRFMVEIAVRFLGGRSLGVRDAKRTIWRMPEKERPPGSG